MSDEIKLTEEQKKGGIITACLDEGKVLFEVSEEKGFVFNRKDHPNAMPDDFAKAFVDILEKEYIVTMEKRKKK